MSSLQSTWREHNHRMGNIMATVLSTAKAQAKKSSIGCAITVGTLISLPYLMRVVITICRKSPQTHAEHPGTEI